MVTLKIPEKIESERLYLRPFKPQDGNPYQAFLIDPEVTRYLDFHVGALSEEDGTKLFEQVIASYATDDPTFALAVARTEDDAFIGSCGLVPTDTAEQYECYFVLLPRYRSKGYAAEALAALLRHAFQELGLQTVVAYIAFDNSAASRVVEKCGLTFREIATYRGTDIERSLYKIRWAEFRSQKIQ
jgi:RimJ/RimL family protein N-acetyltransferase